MDGNFEEKLGNLGTTQSRESLHRAITLLETALGQLQHQQVHPVQGTLREATLLLRQQIDSPTVRVVPDDKGRMLAWQVRMVRDYIDSHIARRVLVADLCALVQRSDAHFSRSFKRTFGESPHAFLVRRRLELATQCMLTSDASLSDIALRCGFSDQAHLSKHFRQYAGQTPSVWRRTHRLHLHGEETLPVE